MNSTTLVLGIGTGRCGSHSLAHVLNQQPDAQVSHEERPLLPWIPQGGWPGIQQRIDRWRRMRSASLIGDVGSSYLPYIEEAIAYEPNVRVVCLKRPKEEVVASFCRWLDQVYPLPTNHWAEVPAAGWYHEPNYTRIFPQYETQDREEGIRRYWDEYYQRSEVLAGKYPNNVRIFDANHVLNTKEGFSDLLSFIGRPPESQILVLNTRTKESATVQPHPRAAIRASADPFDPRKCVVLVPYTGHIVQQCEDGLQELERRGYPVRRVAGYAAIDQGRNQMATDALIDGFEETMWIDSDVGFHPDAIEQIRRHRLPMTCGIYPQKGKQALACHIVPGTPRLVFGRGGGLYELLYAGTGFLHVRREVYITIQEKLRLPMCNERFRRPMIPFFHPMLHPYEDGHWYLAEDYAFSQRARDCGFKILADTTLRLWHFGLYGYSWEDSGIGRDRHATFTLNFPDKIRPEDVQRLRQ